MKKLIWSSMIISFLLGVPACSKKQMKSVLDDISRDTYENHVRKQRIENIGNPTYDEPPSYDHYQRERKMILSEPGISQDDEKIENK